VLIDYSGNHFQGNAPVVDAKFWSLL
jgi:hypothetical protein